MSSGLSSENSENTCVVCFKNVYIFSFGECDHPVCYECSTRMRVLCRQNECPICRQDMPKVIFTRYVQPFRLIKNRTYPMDKKFKICFSNADIQAAYNKLLEHVCKKCPNRPAFRTFQNLKDHVKKEHELFYCDLCVENLKIFSGERRCYTRQELAQHRRKGDPDDTSHRGHPLCEFCDQRYMDNDELFRHLRRDHLFCHFCDADGYHRYYSSYDYLRDHFRTDHFLCEEGGCIDEKFTSAFRTEIDLKAHRASVHGRSMGKAAAKQARTLELEFTLAPRPRDGRDGGRGGRRGGMPRLRSVQEEESLGAVGGRHYNEHSEEGSAIYHNAPSLNTNCVEEFPTLSGGVPGPLPSSRPGSRQVAVNNGALTIRTIHQSKPPLAINDANFPALGSDMPAGSCKTVRLSVNSGGPDRSNQGVSNGNRNSSVKAPTNLSIRVNHRPNGALSTRLSSSQNFPGRPHSEEDFPSLSSSKSNHVPVTSQWVVGQGSTGSKMRTQTPPVSKKVTEDFPSLNSKPSIKNNPEVKGETVTKKASSVMIPVSSSWSGAQDTSNGSNASEANSKVSKPVETEFSGVGNIKVRSKKKKPAKTNSGNEQPSTAKISNGNHSASGGETGKKKKKSGEPDVEEPRKIEPPTSNSVSKEEEIALKLQGILKCTENKNGTIERKRSELLIGNLTSEEEDSVSPTFNGVSFDHNFPLLGSHSSYPPGFLDLLPKPTPAPPPGFGSEGNERNVKSPPPGFSVTLNSVARPQSNNLTFTSSSGQSYSILPDKNRSPHQFIPPHDSDKRNQTLVTKVQKCVDDMDEFLQMSALFRQGSVSAATFYEHCTRTMGQETFSDIFPELLVLLPDIHKQQELLTVHTDANQKLRASFDVCAICDQVLSRSDLRYHQSKHSLENHFSTTAPTWTKD